MNVDNPNLLNFLALVIASLFCLLYIKKVRIFLQGLVLGIIPATFVYVMYQKEMILLYMLISITGLKPLLEEVIKISPLFLIKIENSARSEPIFYGALFGLLFGITENWTYIDFTGSLNIYRILFSTPMHMITSVISSYGVWKHQTEKQRHWMLFLIFSTALHVIYNFIVKSGLIS